MPPNMVAAGQAGRQSGGWASGYGSGGRHHQGKGEAQDLTCKTFTSPRCPSKVGPPESSQTDRMPRRRDIARAFGALVASPLGLRPAASAGAGPSRAIAALPLGEIPVVGTKYHAAARLAAMLLPGQPLRLRRDAANRHDPNAIAVHTPEGEQLGWLPRGEARRIAPLLDAGGQIRAEVEGEAYEATPGNWRLSTRLSLLAEATPPPLGPAAAEQVAQLLRAPPLLAERFRGPDTGGRAVMLAGPCAGWQRTT
ncbi:HIRAN domain-containing protein [Roseicella frigidaeris]|uniref:HIRAN domain-containing protein n=1 Tax=Roseicella frigidaeris TaxID=2230885 RepID=A0A327LW16_9PROT|nr:HIRAN domain-containing protein [Roseicella frigidaeris]RAI54045.1 hypothetical protein DOO78_26740 [Roseicella frigidaeris]